VVGWGEKSRVAERSDVARAKRMVEMGWDMPQRLDLLLCPARVSLKERPFADILLCRNEFLNSKPGRETEASQQMDSVTS